MISDGKMRPGTEIGVAVIRFWEYQYSASKSGPSGELHRLRGVSFCALVCLLVVCFYLFRRLTTANLNEINGLSFVDLRQLYGFFFHSS